MGKLGILRLLYRLFVHGTTKANGLFLWSESMALYQEGSAFCLFFSGHDCVFTLLVITHAIVFCFSYIWYLGRPTTPATFTKTIYITHSKCSSVHLPSLTKTQSPGRPYPLHRRTHFLCHKKTLFGKCRSHAVLRQSCLPPLP
jgi:hypothetical protein